MLPSRGLSRSNPASALRATRSARTQSVRPLRVPLRHFSQAQSRSTLLSRSSGASSTPISLIGSRTVLAATASSVFAQRSGASRNLSLWPFSSKQKSIETEFISPATPPQSSEPVATPEKWAQDSFASAPPAQAPQDVPLSSPADHADLGSAQLEPGSLGDQEWTSILDIPEQIGYLKNLGLDFGWGPTSCCQWLLEHIYIYTGMPWWASLTTVAFAWRILFFKPSLTASKHQARLAMLARDPAYIQAKAEYDEATYKGLGVLAQKGAHTKMLQLKKKYDASTMKSLATLWSFPFTFGMFRLVRAMATLPVPSLETGGMLWFTDLTVHDPYYIMPFASVALTTLMFKQSQAANQTAPNQMSESIQKGMMYILPPTMFLCTAWLPAGIQWFFLMFSAASVVQSSATLNPAVRRWAGIPPLPAKTRGFPPTAAEAGAAWQAPDSSIGQNIMGKIMGDGTTKQKEHWKKAQDYGERRALEEKENTRRRIDEIRRRRAEKERS
ncbi:60Kd inner membrane protein-domain-containing protein [Annulohypoxylon bovei var. microspora]|nr:60Kd inner membrane protein-domain-containing protein [Annulohypoxylon bovei var. microspora]